VPATATAKQAVQQAKAFEHGHFVFADGEHATTKIEMDHLWEHPRELATVLSLLARADGLPPADVILGVPTGGQLLADALAAPAYTGLPIARLERVPGGAKQDYRFTTPADRTLALSAKSPRIYEDVVSTLSSIAGVVRLLDPSRQDIHALAIWRRGRVRDHYRRGVTDHYLVEEAVTNYSPEDCPVCVTTTPSRVAT
jgi:orotate phosphoribosyltransferase